MTICRSIGGRTTADSCREDTGTSFIVATMQVHTSQPKREAEMLTDIMSRSNHASTSAIYIPNLHTDAFTVYTHMYIDTIVGLVQVHTCICLHIPTIMA